MILFFKIFVCLFFITFIFLYEKDRKEKTIIREALKNNFCRICTSYLGDEYGCSIVGKCEYPFNSCGGNFFIQKNKEVKGDKTSCDIRV